MFFCIRIYDHTLNNIFHPKNLIKKFLCVKSHENSTKQILMGFTTNKTNNILNLQCQRSYPEAFDCRLDKEVCVYIFHYMNMLFFSSGWKYIFYPPVCGTDIEKSLHFSCNYEKIYTNISLIYIAWLLQDWLPKRWSKRNKESSLVFWC